MKRLVIGVIAAGVLVSVPQTVMGQSKTITYEQRTETGVIEAIEASTRTVSLRKPDGTIVTTVAPPDIKRFAELKVGDKVTARFYENLVVRLKAPGEPEGYSASKATTPSEQAMPGGTKAKQVQITATITAIDPALPSISFTGPNGWKYTSKVQDKAALGKVKVGDKVEITWTEAVLVSVEPGK
jgi:hypothetical protein